MPRGPMDSSAAALQNELHSPRKGREGDGQWYCIIGTGCSYDRDNCICVRGSSCAGVGAGRVTRSIFGRTRMRLGHVMPVGMDCVEDGALCEGGVILSQRVKEGNGKPPRTGRFRLLYITSMVDNLHYEEQVCAAASRCPPRWGWRRERAGRSRMVLILKVESRRSAVPPPLSGKQAGVPVPCS